MNSCIVQVRISRDQIHSTPMRNEDDQEHSQQELFSGTPPQHSDSFSSESSDEEINFSTNRGAEYDPSSPGYNIASSQHSYNPTSCPQFIPEPASPPRKKQKNSSESYTQSTSTKVPLFVCKKSNVGIQEKLQATTADVNPISRSGYSTPALQAQTTEANCSKQLVEVRHSTPPRQVLCSDKVQGGRKKNVSSHTFSNLPPISYQPAALPLEVFKPEFDWWILPQGYSEMTQKSGQRFLIIKGAVYDATCFVFQVERSTRLFRPAFANLPDEYYELLNHCEKWDSTHSGASPINIKYMALSLQNKLIERETGWSQDDASFNIFNNKNVNENVYDHSLQELAGKKNIFKPPTLIINSINSEIDIFEGVPLDNNHLKHSATIEAALKAVPIEQLRKVNTADLALYAKTLELAALVTNSVNALSDPEMSYQDRQKEAKHVTSSAHLMMRYQREAFTRCSVPILRAKEEARNSALKDIQCNIAKDFLQKDNLFSKNLFSSTALQKASKALEEKNFRSVHITVSSNHNQKGGHSYSNQKRDNYSSMRNNEFSQPNRQEGNFQSQKPYTKYESNQQKSNFRRPRSHDNKRSFGSNQQRSEPSTSSYQYNSNRNRR